MAIFQYENLTHAELSALPRERTVILVSAGPLEQHSLHLPLGTDAMTASYFSTQIAQQLQNKKSDWNFVVLPPLFAGVDTLTYAGSIEVKASVLRALLYANCAQLAKDGFKFIIGVSAHGGPRHNVVFEEVASKLRWRHRTNMVVASAKLIMEVLSGGFVEKLISRLEKQGMPLSQEAKTGLVHDYHAGMLETSLMMVVRPDLVHENYKTLAPALVDSYLKIRPNSGKTVGEGLGHLGSPALATKEIGQAAIELFLEQVSEPLEQFLEGKNVRNVFRSKLYYVPFFRTDFKLFLFIVVYLVAFAFLISFMNRFLVEIYK